MTKLSNGTVVTDLHNDLDNQSLSGQGYSIRHIETYNTTNESFIVWNAPEITEADLAF